MNALSLINAGKLGLIMLLVSVALLACDPTIQLTPIYSSVPTPTLAPSVTPVPTPTRIIMPPVATLTHPTTPVSIPISIDPGITKLVTGDKVVVSVAPDWRQADLKWEITFVSSNLIADPGKLSSSKGPTIV